MSDPYSPYPENPGGYGSSAGSNDPYSGQPLPPTEYGAYPPQQQSYYPPPQQQPYASNDYNPYAAPPVYQPYVSPAQPGQTNIPGIVSLVLGITSIVLSWVFFLGLPGSIAGVILGIIGMRRTTGKGLAVGGLVCSIIGLVLSACIGILLIIGISNSSQY